MSLEPVLTIYVFGSHIKSKGKRLLDYAGYTDMFMCVRACVCSLVRIWSRVYISSKDSRDFSSDDRRGRMEFSPSYFSLIPRGLFWEFRNVPDENGSFLSFCPPPFSEQQQNTNK